MILQKLINKVVYVFYLKGRVYIYIYKTKTKKGNIYQGGDSREHWRRERDRVVRKWGAKDWMKGRYLELQDALVSVILNKWE